VFFLGDIKRRVVGVSQVTDYRRYFGRQKPDDNSTTRNNEYGRHKQFELVRSAFYRPAVGIVDFCFVRRALKINVVSKRQKSISF